MVFYICRRFTKTLSNGDSALLAHTLQRLGEKCLWVTFSWTFTGRSLVIAASYGIAARGLVRERSSNTWSHFSDLRNSFFLMTQLFHRKCDSRSFCMSVSETAVITVLTFCDSIDSFSSLAPLLQAYNRPFLCHVLVTILPLVHQPGVPTFCFLC